MLRKKNRTTAFSHLLISAAIAACIFVTVSCSVDSGTTTPSQPDQPILAPAPGSPITIPFAPGGVLLGDVNNDETLDIFVRSSESPAILVLLGVGDGQFLAAQTDPVQLQEPASEIAAGDINGDGRLDLALGSHDSYRIQLLLGDGTGSFLPAENPYMAMKDGQHPHTHGLALGDLNNDGYIDLVTGNTTDGDVSVALGDGNGGFVRADESPFTVGQGPYPLTLGDLNNDGFLDIVVTSTLNANGKSGEALTVLLGDGQGGFTRFQAPVRTLDPWFVAIGDVNGDRISDLVSTHWEGRELTVLIGNGDGSFKEVAESPFNLGHAAWYVGIADMNGDGFADVVAAADKGVRLMLGDGRGGFMPAPGSPFQTGGGSWRLAIGDFNGDGKLDIVTSDLEGNSVTVLLAR